MFFNYEKSKIEDLICKEVNVECYIKGEIKYSFFPSPRIKFNDFIIKEEKTYGIVIEETTRSTVSILGLGIVWNIWSCLAEKV